MPLAPCRECKQSISNEAAACPRCGAPQRPAVPPLLPPQEEILYSDNVVAVTNVRVTISGATYALRNVTSVKMASSPPQIFVAIVLLLVGIFVFLLFYLRPDDAVSPAGAIFL